MTKHPITGRDLPKLEAADELVDLALPDIGPRELASRFASSVERTIGHLATTEAGYTIGEKSVRGLPERLEGLVDLLVEIVDAEALRLERRTAIALEGTVEIAEKEQPK